MAVIEGRTWLEMLSPPACRELLGSQTTGRIGVVVGGHPEIFPVNYGVDEDGTIVFRTDPGTKLASVEHGPTICFEIDHADDETKRGWSVLVVGVAHRVTDSEELAQIRALGFRPWAVGEKSHVVRVVPTSISGRRIHRSIGDSPS